MTAETALTARHDAQRALDRGMTLQEAGKRAERVNSALADLFDVANHERNPSPELWAAVRAVKEARA